MTRKRKRNHPSALRYAVAGEFHQSSLHYALAGEITRKIKEFE
jgi:hypothetical protein